MESYELGEPFVSISAAAAAPAVGTPVSFTPRPGRLFPRDTTAVISKTGAGAFSVNIEVNDKSDGSGTWSVIDTITATGYSLVNFVGTVLNVRANLTAIDAATTVTVKFLAS